MLLRREDGGVLAIGQPSHAWISGQLARAWGNERFGAVEPGEEVCLAAEQHDTGMAAWDLNPSWNPETLLPRSFMEMPIPVHLELWTAGPRRLLRQSRYAALLAAMHGRRLYEIRDLGQLSPQDADAVRAFLRAQQAFEDQLLASLRADSATSAVASPELVARNSQLIWTWDFLSLAICLDWAPTAAREVPTAQRPTDLRMTPAAGEQSIIVDPWPFRQETVAVRCEGQLLGDRFDSPQALQRALVRAPWETLELTLTAP